MTDLNLTSPLVWTGSDWEGRITLPSWAGGLPGRGVSSDGSAPLNVVAPKSGPTPAQFAAVRHLLDHETEVAAAVRAAVFAYYPEAREATEAADELPVLTDPAELAPLMALERVIVDDTERGGVAYVGFQFRCLWEYEHGCGVLLHRSRVVAAGEADTAVEGWAAKQDAAK